MTNIVATEPPAADLDKPVKGLDAQGLKKRSGEASRMEPAWTSQPMGARVDLENKESVHERMDDDGA